MSLWHDDPARVVIEITPNHRFGYRVSICNGPSCYGVGFAWTRAQAERKGRRIVEKQILRPVRQKKQTERIVLGRKVDLV